MVSVNGLSIEYREGMVLSDALAEAGVDTTAAILITVNSAYTEKSGASRMIITDGTEIRVMPILSGG